MLAVYRVIYGSSLLRNMERKMQHLNILKEKLMELGGNEIQLDLQGGEHFTFTPVISAGDVMGVSVSNLRSSPFLPIDVFSVVISLLVLSSEYTANKGDAMNFALGEEGLPLNSVEGHVANVIYGTDVGVKCLRRITPISHILHWAGIVENGRGYLKLI